MISLRYKYNSNPQLELNTKKIYKNGLGFKSNGFWYAYGKKWVKYISANYSDFIKDKPYKYNISINTQSYTKNLNNIKNNKILILNSMKDIDNFMVKYVVVVKVKNKNNFSINDKYNFMHLLNWNKVSNDFSGIEIRYLPTKKFIDNYETPKYLWLDILDAPSGCIWNFTNIHITITKNN